MRTTAAALSWVLLSRLLGSTPLTQFLLIGQIFVVSASAAAWAVPTATWDRWDGTFYATTITPTNYFHVLLWRTSVWCVHGIASGLLTAVILWQIFSREVARVPPFELSVAVVASCLSAYTCALAHGAVVARWPHLRNIVLGLLTIEFSAFTGAMVPRSYWPAQVEHFAVLLPVTHALAAFRDHLAGSSASFSMGIAKELLVAVIWLVTAQVALILMTAGLRHNGTAD